MGGFGTWSLAIEHPEEFAAIVPICVGGDTIDIWKLRHTAVWCFGKRYRCAAGKGKRTAFFAPEQNVPFAANAPRLIKLHFYKPFLWGVGVGEQRDSNPGNFITLPLRVEYWVQY